MKAILVTVAALGCVTFAGLSAYADPDSPTSNESFVPVADSGDGAGLPGLPGGRAGKSGRELARESGGRYAGSDFDDQSLVDYCIEVLRNKGRARSSGDTRPTDCMDLFIAAETGRAGGRYGQAGEPGEPGQSGRRGGDGADGASIDGGIGGQGGRAGAGPGGGAGGAGGKGVSGGQGGQGGRGGSAY